MSRSLSIVLAFALVMAASRQVASSATRSSRPAFVDDVTVVVAHAPSQRHVTRVATAAVSTRADHRHPETTRSSNP
jgi:hypothetical protein